MDKSQNHLTQIQKRTCGMISLLQNPRADKYIVTETGQLLPTGRARSGVTDYKVS